MHLPLMPIDARSERGHRSDRPLTEGYGSMASTPSTAATHTPWGSPCLWGFATLLWVCVYGYGVALLWPLRGFGSDKCAPIAAVWIFDWTWAALGGPMLFMVVTWAIRRSLARHVVWTYYTAALYVVLGLWASVYCWTCTSQDTGQVAIWFLVTLGLLGVATALASVATYFRHAASRTREVAHGFQGAPIPWHNLPVFTAESK